MLTHEHMSIHTHTPAGGSELQTKSLTLWHFFGRVVQVSSAHRLLNKWIWNDLPRVSATWAQTHTPRHTHTTQASSLPPCCSYRDADAETHQHQAGKERNLAEQPPIVSPWVTLSDKHRGLPMWVSSYSLDSRFVIWVDLHPFVFRHNGKYDWGRTKNSRFPDLGFSCDVCNIISWNIHYYMLTAGDVSTEAAAHRTTGSGQDIRITAAVVTYKPLAIILEESTSLCFCDKNAEYVS